VTRTGEVLDKCARVRSTNAVDAKERTAEIKAMPASLHGSSERPRQFGDRVSPSGDFDGMQKLVSFAGIRLEYLQRT